MRPTHHALPELGTGTSPTLLARALRDQPGLAVLAGDWHDGGAVIAFRPLAVLEPDADPFVALATDPRRAADRGEGGEAGGVAHAETEGSADTAAGADDDAGPRAYARTDADTPASPRPGFGGGWIGYLGYQLSSTVELLPPAPPRPVPLPPAYLAFYDCVLLHDATTGRWQLEHLCGAQAERVAQVRVVVQQAAAALGVGRAHPAGPTGPGGGTTGPDQPPEADRTEPDRPPEADRTEPDQLSDPEHPTRPSDSAVPRDPVAPTARPYRIGPVGADISGADHARSVARAQAYIASGDVYQVNVCRRLSADFTGDPLDLFCTGVEELRPRFGAFLRLPGGAVASLSPELFLRRAGDVVLTSPIKGTATLESDPAELAGSAKDHAENIMIVDLMRNDLSRVAEPGSVSVDALARVQEHTGVRHLVSDVRAQLRPGTGDDALLRATFPPGSCTGAPKVRAMELINTLERSAREVYTGAVGYSSGQAGLTLNVAIRTFEFADGRIWLGAGGGVVAGSDPQDEAHETLVKARPLLAAVGADLDDELAAEWAGHLARRAQRSKSPDPEAGVFTTTRVDDGVPADLAAHLARLGRSVEVLYGRALPRDLESRVVAAAARLQGPHRLRVEATPGPADLSIELSWVPLPPGPPEPWRLTPVVLPHGMGSHKWADRSRLELPDPDGDPWSPTHEPLLVDLDGAVLEAAKANIYLVDADGTVRTPELDGRMLPGVARARTLAALAAEGIPAVETRTTLDHLGSAREVFVTNAVVGVLPVVSVTGVGSWSPGPVAAVLSWRLAPVPPSHPHGTARLETQVPRRPDDSSSPERPGLRVHLP